MISKFDLAKALLNQAQLISDDNSYLLIPDGEAYTPDPNTTYIQEFTIYGDDTERGTEDGSKDLQLGIYQININAPKSNEGAKWLGLQIGGVFQTGFARGTELTFNGQMVRMRNSSLKPMDGDDTHEIHILSVSFSVIN